MMSDLSKLFDWSKNFAPPNIMLRLKNYCMYLHLQSISYLLMFNKNFATFSSQYNMHVNITLAKASFSRRFLKGNGKGGSYWPFSHLTAFQLPSMLWFVNLQSFPLYNLHQSTKEIKIVLRLILLIAMYCQGSSSQIKPITLPLLLLAGWEGSLGTYSR